MSLLFGRWQTQISNDITPISFGRYMSKWEWNIFFATGTHVTVTATRCYSCNGDRSAIATHVTVILEISIFTLLSLDVTIFICEYCQPSDSITLSYVETVNVWRESTSERVTVIASGGNVTGRMIHKWKSHSNVNGRRIHSNGNVSGSDGKKRPHASEAAVRMIV